MDTLCPYYIHLPYVHAEATTIKTIALEPNLKKNNPTLRIRLISKIAWLHGAFHRSVIKIDLTINNKLSFPILAVVIGWW